MLPLTLVSPLASMATDNSSTERAVKTRNEKRKDVMKKRRRNKEIGTADNQDEGSIYRPAASAPLSRQAAQATAANRDMNLSLGWVTTKF